MFGYACRETPELMPAPIYYAHRILKMMAEARQVRRRRPSSAPTPRARSRSATRTASRSASTSIVVSTQHLDEDADLRRRARHRRAVSSAQALPEGWIDADTVWHVNPTGKFVIGGPDGDAGLTGRKIIVDTYGGAAPHGGGAFSGKDPTKVDRSAAYAARYLAKNVVAADLADRCTIQLSYAIGVSAAAVDLCRPARHRQGRRGQAREGARKSAWTSRRAASASISASTGRSMPAPPPTAISAAPPEADGGFSWEKTDLVDALRDAVR